MKALLLDENRLDINDMITLYILGNATEKEVAKAFGKTALSDSFVFELDFLRLECKELFYYKKFLEADEKIEAFIKLHE